MKNCIPGKGPKRLILVKSRAKKPNKSGTLHSAAMVGKPRWPVKGGHD
jgi:hypothetical protein